MPKVWLFDLDDTLHDASARIFPKMNAAMTQYIQDHLHLSEPDANALRQHYWRVYGATLKGLVRHHGVDPHHFLAATHDLDLADMVIPMQRLKHTLNQLDGKKCVFTNAPKAYALQVLQLLGLGRYFSLVFHIESNQFHAKPSQRGFAKVLQRLPVNASDCVMVEDSLPALMTANRLGMQTVWITQQRRKPLFVDYRLNSVLALTHIRL